MNEGSLAMWSRVVLVLLAGLASCAARPDDGGRTLRQSLSFDGRERHYVVRLPGGLGRRGPLPLLVGLHGGGGRGGQLGVRYGLDALAEREGVIAVYPDAVERTWNDGRRGTGYTAHEKAIDDVGFVRAVVGELLNRYDIDTRRIYVTGISNGGMMTLRLACEAADLFAAAAAVTAAFPEDFAPRCQPSRPIPVMIVNGTEDQLVPFDGGEIRFGRRRLGRVWSTRRTLGYWLRHNGCPATPKRELRPDADPRDGTTVAVERYKPCRAGSEVVLFTVDGGGHAWPGEHKSLPAFLVGRPSRDIDGTAEIWRFLGRHRL